VHALRKQFLTPNYTRPNGKHSFGKSSPAGKTSAQTISQQKLTWIPSPGSSVRALRREYAGFWMDLGFYGIKAALGW